MSSPLPKRKILLLGASKTGKTSLVYKQKKSQQKVEMTMGVEVSPVKLNNTVFNIWDCAGDARFQGLRDGYYAGTDGVIIVSDPTRDGTVAEADVYLQMISRMYEHIPIVFVSNVSELLQLEKPLDSVLDQFVF
jgi:GTP-binding nuclear protein Ran